MAYRNITNITLYKSGLICCRDKHGRQAPPLQGYFKDVINKIKEHFKPEDVEWIFDNKPLSFGEWAKIGDELAIIDVEHKNISVDELMKHSHNDIIEE